MEGGFLVSKPIEEIIECPFYIREGTAFITCEGVLEKTTTTHRFESNKEKLKYEQHFCCLNGGRKCLHYRSISVLYERGVRA